MLAIGSEELRHDISDLVEDSMPSLGPELSRYVAEVLVFPLASGLLEIRLTGAMALNREYERYGSKARQLRQLGDMCLCAGVFYLDEMQRTEDQTDMVLEVGQHGYRVAALYSDGEEAYICNGMSDQFMPVVARLNPPMQRYLGGRGIPKLILWTSEGQKIFRAGYSQN